jgi:hypothetical protein
MLQNSDDEAEALGLLTQLDYSHRLAPEVAAVVGIEQISGLGRISCWGRLRTAHAPPDKGLACL